MKLLQLSLLLLLIPLALQSQAIQQPTDSIVELLKPQPACHLAEARKTEYCQNVMFPPVPFR
ncbi:hypothetical protein [Oceanicoccus sp. KOV_DT_Chl]|uniref:hypothetical protein n=1 Tax=Oceanicoccus sp. KOV_DT_Chl TaxID=1904639 RepID=UPI000C797BED|nr:hypothetical protein [Oceanicoccus sp. KOV_DT_Chl]